METNQITQKNADYKYICYLCDFNSNKNNDYERHLLTSKHKRLTYTNNSHANYAQTSIEFICECGKQYKHQSSLCKHKKKCSIENIIEDTKPKDKLSDVSDKDQLIMILIKENAEFKNMMMEQQNIMMKVIENGTNNTNITHTNSHNKAFNLNFFLNETCKDAMNITDFVDSIKLQLADLEKVGEVGYVEGISNIIIKNLNDLDETKRPVHCTDKKRETIYIKDQGHWEKEDDNKTKFKKAINKIANKNIKLISQFREKYPECRKSESSISDKYNKMIIEAMGGPGDNTAEKEEKIIRNITKVTTINK
jgi:hypothetical protein